MPLNTKIYDTEAMQYLLSAIEKVKLTKNVFVSQRPSTVSEQMNDFIVVTCPGSWQDKGPWQQCLVRFQCFARVKPHGIIHVAKIGKMKDTILSKMPWQIADNMTLRNFKLIHNATSDGMGFGYCTIHAQLWIETPENV